MDTAQQNEAKKLNHIHNNAGETILNLAQAANEIRQSFAFTENREDAIKAHQRILQLIADYVDTCYDSRWSPK